MKWMKILPILTAAMLLAAACNFPLIAGRQEDPADMAATAVQMTIQAMDAQAQPTAPPQATPTPPGPVPTTQASQPPTGPTALPGDTCDKAEFVAETIPDGTEFATGASFTKEWTFRNTGTCTWNTNYRMVFVEGDSMNGPASVTLPNSVAPNEQVTVAVNLTAPSQAGNYKGFWQLWNESNKRVYDVWVDIAAVSEPFTVTSVYTKLEDVSAPCPYIYPIDIYITANKQGTVSYQTKTSEGATSAVKTVKFDQAGTQTVELDWQITTNGDYWLQVYIKEPNNQWWGQDTFEVTCE